MIRPRLIILALLSVLLLSATGVYAQAPAPQGTPLGSGFTYQGQLKKHGKSFDGTCDFQFSLYDIAVGGNQAGSLLTQTDVKVIKGVFAAKLDFGASVFTGDARWLQVAVKCPGDEGFVIFTTRQELTPTPYAIGLVPGAVVTSTANDSLTGRSDTGRGLAGFSNTWQGVYGFSRDQAGVVGESNGFDGVYGITNHAGFAGVSGHNNTDGGGFGVWGYDKGPIGSGIFGVSDLGVGVIGISRADNQAAVFGSNEAAGTGVFGRGERGDGVIGEARMDGRSGVFGNNLAGGSGVFGTSVRGFGVGGHSANGTGAWGESDTFEGVHGQAHGNAAGVAGVNTGVGPGLWGTSVNGTGVYGYSATGYAGDFNGKVRVKTLEIAGGADLAEPFDVHSATSAAIIPGMVVCIDPTHPGKLVICANAYDRTVAGVISGAGGVEPGMVMRQDGSAADGQHPVALTGRVYVWADATQQPIHPGDLLTTSATPGHAAKATDHDAAQGAIIGKAMGALESGKGLVLVLVNLQ